jgi:hypothetical protein
MKRFLFISLLSFITLSVFAQKVTIQVVRTKNSGIAGWQIIDSQNNIIFSGSEGIKDDSVTFSLVANTYYFLKISISEISNPDAKLFSLSLNGEPVLYIKSDVGKGDHLFPFFTGVREVNAKIIGGVNAVISDFPWQIYYIAGNFRCGGSIIGGTWVVTAAHCTKNSTGGAIVASDMFVKVGVNNPANPAEGITYAVREAIVHEGFDNQTLLNDIALLRLKDTIHFANALPIKLVTTDDVVEGAIIPGVMSWVTGWGYTHINPNVIPNALQKVQLPIVSNAQASSVWNSIPATDLMAGYLNGNKDACNGDSGGPLVVPVLGEYKLAGIVSWGSSNCNTYGAYTRVSDFETWIRTKTGIARDFKPPPPEGEALICQGTESSQYSVQPVTGATIYEWKLIPATAGVISGNSGNASVLWNISYVGPVTIALRVTINNKVSDWSRFDGNVVFSTKLIKQSRDTTICADQMVILSVSAEGYNLSYKWFKNGVLVQSGLSSAYVISNSTTDNSGDYKCEISGFCGVIVSNIMKLTVHPVTKITHVSPLVEVPFGNDITLEVNSEGHDLVYEWQKDGSVISNSNTPQLFLPTLNATDIGIYKVTVAGTCGTEISDTIYLYVKRANFTTEPEVFLWPSVTDTEFKVALSNDKYYNIRIYNAMGRKIRELINCQYETSINISNIAHGIYIVEVYNNSFRKSIKVIRN